MSWSITCLDVGFNDAVHILFADFMGCISGVDVQFLYIGTYLKTTIISVHVQDSLWFTSIFILFI